MPTDERWTTETEALVAKALAPHWYDQRDARAVLSALADAGLLLPPGGEVSVEWGILIARSDGTTYVDSGDDWWWTEDQARDELAD
jgi:hypothetical protein